MLLALFSAQVSLAATIVVDGTTCTLAQAITAANVGGACGTSNYAGSAGADTITLTDDVTVSANLPQVTSTITVEGNTNTINGNATHRLFYLSNSGNLTVNNVTLAQGKTSQDGGGIYAWKAQVTVTNSTIRANSAGRDGGGIYVAGTGATLTVSNSTIIGNTADSITGGITFAGATATLTHVTLLDNQSYGASTLIPSGLYVGSKGLKLRNSIISSNDANTDCYLGSGASFSENVGNLIENNSCSPAASGDPNFGTETGSPAYFPLQSTSPALGIGNDAVCKETNRDQTGIRRPATACDAGAVERGGYNDIYVDAACDLVEAMSNAEGNNQGYTDCEGGVADDIATDVLNIMQNVTIASAPTGVWGTVIVDGRGHSVTMTGGGTARIFFIELNGTLTVRNITLIGGSQDRGGAIYSAGDITLEDCVIKNAVATREGGGFYHRAGTATVTRCVFDNNLAGGGQDQYGGGIFMRDGTLTVSQSAFTNNRAWAKGGGIYINDGTLTLSSSTFSANYSAADGGAILINGGTATLAHLTIWDNTTNSVGAVTGIQAGGTTNLYNSIIGRASDQGEALCGGTFQNSATERGIITFKGPQTDNCGTVTVANPLLGGQTGAIPYLPLRAGSPAIGKGIDAQCANYPVDQAGKARPATDCDIGSTQHIAEALGVSAPVALSGSDGGAYAGPGRASAPEPPVCTGEALNESGVFKVSTTYGLCNGVQFNQLELSAIGIGYVVEAGPLAAVDVWGWVTAYVDVCYRGQASALFLDAAASPRLVSQLASVWDGEWTCAQISRAGTIVLMPADSYLTTPPVDAAAPESPPATTPLANCMARLDYILNFRETPGGAVMMHLPYGVKLTAFQRTADWVEVDWHGQRGWVSAHHVSFEGDC